MKKRNREIIENNCNVLINSKKTLEDIFKITFSRPEEIMAEWLEDRNICSMTFAEGEKRIRIAADELRREIGSKNTYVALDMENSVRWIIAFWGILMSGNKPYLVNRRHPAKLTRGAISTLNITFAVAEGEISYPCIYIDGMTLGQTSNENCGEDVGNGSRSGSKVGGGIGSKDNGNDGCADNGPDFAGTFANELALSTSATTLNEVICIYTGEQVANQIMNCEGILKENKLMAKFYHGSLKQLAFLPFYHIFGLMAVYFWFSFFSRTMVFIEDYSADSILTTARKLEVTHIFAVPMLWHAIEKQVKARVRAQGPKKEKKFYKGLEISTKLQNAFPNAGRFIALRMMKEITSRLFGYSPSFLISGGGFIKDSALYMFNGLGYPLHNGYGMSETGITSVELRSKVKHRNENSIGKPFDSVRYKIEKDGVLYVSGDSICVKIIRNGVEIPMEKRYNTGDIAFEDSEGNYYLKGRIDDRIIGESGENVNPDEIEKHLDFEHALNLCVWGEGEGSAEEIALVIQLGRDLSKKKIEETAQAAFAQSDKLPGTYQIRKFYFTFDPICAETAVKVSRSYLKRGLANGSIKIYPFADVLEGRVSGREAIDPLNELAVKARDAFAEFLDVAAEDIYMDDHFIYDLNGTSLDYFSLVIKINEVMGIHLTFDKESACHTVRDFCREIEKRGLN